jgi:allophanate hydrolase
MTPSERVAAAFARIREVDRPEVWIALRDRADLAAEAAVLERRVLDGQRLPLAGLIVAVKDNIDVGGLPTTAGCPAYAYRAAADAPAVARLRAAGALVLGKTSLDQFATGLVGTRSPYGAVRDARDPTRVAGGSSSGSAVAVALGICDLALGTDTAGSGRVPAAFQGIVGAKPTRGIVSVRGVVPACRSFDCVSVFARRVGLARTAVEIISGHDPDDPLSRTAPPGMPSAAPYAARIAVAAPAQLGSLSGDARAAYLALLARLRMAGAETVEIDLEPFLAAGALLYGGAFVGERYAAVGAFVAANREAVDPVVAEIILGAAGVSAAQYVADVERLDALRAQTARTLDAFDALLLPTVPFQPTLADVEADPVGCNQRLGRFTTFANLLDLCAYAVPAGTADGGQFGVTLLAPAFHDQLVADLAQRVEATGEGTALLVVGAHMRGGPLTHELTSRGGWFLGDAHTAPAYQLFRLDTAPPKPGLVRAAEAADGVAIAGELWSLPEAGLGSLLAALPTPMALGRVRLSDGSDAVGFLCEPAALAGAEEISALGGWRAHLAARERHRHVPARS